MSRILLLFLLLFVALRWTIGLAGAPSRSYKMLAFLYNHFPRAVWGTPARCDLAHGRGGLEHVSIDGGSRLLPSLCPFLPKSTMKYDQAAGKSPDHGACIGW